MKSIFCFDLRRALGFGIAGISLLSGFSAGSQCLYLPPGGPIAFGLHEVSRVVVDSQVADSPIWLDDGRVVIGAALSSQGGFRRGAIWVYGLSYSSLHDPQSYILPPLPAISTVNGAFGKRLATSGSWLAASARLTNDSHTVCLFQIANGGSLTFRTNLLGNPDINGDRFGDGEQAMAMHGRWLAVIRYGLLSRVHLFRVNDDGVWEARQQLELTDYEFSSLPNTTVLALNDRTLAVGIPPYASSGGRVDVFRRDDADNWNYETSLAKPNFNPGIRFGASLAMAANRIFVSAPGFEATATNSGGIFLFRRENGDWFEETRIVSAELPGGGLIGEHIAYSSLTGEFLVDGSHAGLRMFQPTGNGTAWAMVSRGHPGRQFRNWESPAGTIKSYGYDTTNSIVRTISVRAHQVLTGYTTGFAALHEHGWHSIEAWHFSGDPPCSSRPVFYRWIGAPRSDQDRLASDMDGDGISDFAEIYFGTFLKTNLLSSGLQANLFNGNQRTVRWPRVADTNLLVKGYVEWSTNLFNWTSQGLTVTKVADEPDTDREIVEVTLPNTPASVYLRLQITTPPPPLEP